jgi:hypothetical protein
MTRTCWTSSSSSTVMEPFIYADYCVGDASSLFASSDIPAAPISEQTVS